MKFERNKPPNKWIVQVVIGLVIVSQSLALFGDVLLGGIVDKYPELLIALNPRNRNLALVHADDYQIDIFNYYVIGFARLVASDPLYFLLGFWYGDKALAWIKRRSRSYGPLVDEGQELFKKFSYPLIFMAPNNIICAMSAATGVKLKTFLILNLSGTVARLILIHWLGDQFGGSIQSVVDFIVRYRWQVVGISVALAAVSVYGEFFKKDSEGNLLKEINKEAADSEESENETNADSEDIA